MVLHTEKMKIILDKKRVIVLDLMFLNLCTCIFIEILAYALVASILMDLQLYDTTFDWLT